ncbi:hypothetical protein INR49_013941 [Caranx melampygus]|nr:hypothetical protein INR49_013941 [Caranx melampygus]
MSEDRALASQKPPPHNWILQHPAYQQMKDLEVEDSAQLHAAFLAYMDLSEGREKEGAPTQTVLPLPVHRSLSHSSIRHVLDRGFPMLLCAVASDSTLVYQRMTDGLVTPDPPVGPFQDLGRRQHRKRRQQR